MAGVTPVAATREPESSFFKTTALGKTRITYARSGIRVRVVFDSTRGLPEWQAGYRDYLTKRSE